MFRILLSLFLVAFASNAMAQNYAATAGAGLTFGANLVGGVLYPQQNMCDPTTPARCIVIDASGRPTVNINGTVTVTGTVAATQSGTWTVQPGNTANTTAWLVTGTGGTFPATQSGTWTVQPGNTANTTPWLTSISQGGNTAIVKAGNTFAGTEQALGVAVTNTLPPGQAVMASSSPVVIASNQTANALWGHGVTGAAVPANATYFGYNSGGNLTGASSSAPLPVRAGDGTRQAVIDPCEAATQTYAPISITTATTTRIVTPSASNKTYICGLILVTAAANNVGIVEGTGGTCGSGTAGVIGGTTAANGPNYSANGGMVLQASKTAHAQTAGTNVDLCLITSAATPLAGGIRYVQAP